MKTAIIIPAYQEASRIQAVISAIKDKAEMIVVIDDGSADNTTEIAKAENITVITHPINLGQGAALQTGNEWAYHHGADIVVHFDGDGQFLPEEIKDICQPIINNAADIVFGSRFLGKEENMPILKKRVIMPLARLFNRLFFGIKNTDPQTGFRAMNRKAIETITIENSRMAHCTEIMAKAAHSDLRIKEVPVTVIYNNFGQGMSGGMRIIKDLFYHNLKQ